MRQEQLIVGNETRLRIFVIKYLMFERSNLLSVTTTKRRKKTKSEVSNTLFLTTVLRRANSSKLPSIQQSMFEHGLDE
jgi:hypothetical protein